MSVLLCGSSEIWESTYIDVPYATIDVIGARSVPDFRSIATYSIVPLLLLKVPHSTRKQASTNQVQETCRGHKEHLDMCR